MLKAVVTGWVESTQFDLLRRTVRTPWTFAGIFSDDPTPALMREMADADVFVGHELSAEIIACARRLRLVHCAGAGYDGIDLNALPPGCAVCNVYEHEVPIAEYVMLNALLLATRQHEYERGFRNGGSWRGSGRFNGEFHGELAGATLGLIGYGHIGREVARRARAFDMRVLAIRRSAGAIEDPALDWSGGPDQLDRLLAKSDYVVIACPLSPQTRGMIGARELKLMKPSAVLINPSRAHVCDEQALFEALESRQIAGAALDVWYRYPSTIEQEMSGSQWPFHKLENVIVTPHLSAWTEPMMRRRFTRIAENLDRFARGQPLASLVRAAKDVGTEEASQS